MFLVFHGNLIPGLTRSSYRHRSNRLRHSQEHNQRLALKITNRRTKRQTQRRSHILWSRLDRHGFVDPVRKVLYWVAEGPE